MPAAGRQASWVAASHAAAVTLVGRLAAAPHRQEEPLLPRAVQAQAAQEATPQGPLRPAPVQLRPAEGAAAAAGCRPAAHAGAAGPWATPRVAPPSLSQQATAHRTPPRREQWSLQQARPLQAWAAEDRRPALAVAHLWVARRPASAAARQTAARLRALAAAQRRADPPQAWAAAPQQWAARQTAAHQALAAAPRPALPAGERRLA
jgi:hypothetical protein